MKTAEIVAQGKKALAAAVAEYEKTKKPPEGAKDAKGRAVTRNAPPPGWIRKTVVSWLASYKTHEAFVEDILGLDKAE